MGVMDRFERRLDRLVNGVFARAFKSEVQPVEVAAALQRECDDRAAIVSRDRTIVPNDFTVELGAHDHERLVMYAEPLGAELAAMVGEHAEEQGYQFMGPVAVGFELVDELETGVFRVRSQVAAGGSGAIAGAVAGTASGPAGPPAETVAGAAQVAVPVVSAPAGTSAALELKGSTLQLTRRHTVLGRGVEADVRLDDAGVSRKHAEIVLSDPPRITDLGSTNGTYVDGERVASAELYDGVRLVLGSVSLVFRYGG